LSYFNLALRNFHDSGNTTNIRSRWLPSPPSSTGWDVTKRRRQSPVSRSAPNAASFPNLNTTITHLRDVLGDQTYESLARKGDTMTTAEIVTYGDDQIDRPGPSGAERRLESEHICDSTDPLAGHVIPLGRIGGCGTNRNPHSPACMAIRAGCMDCLLETFALCVKTA